MRVRWRIHPRRVPARAAQLSADELAVPKGIDVEAAAPGADDDIARPGGSGRADRGRVDDADAGVIERRLELFHANTRPILEFYEARGILVTVDAAEPAAAVTQAILAALGVDAA